MEFSLPLQPAILLKRYKRFLADAITLQGETITLHCANTGAMTGCAEPGSTIWYSTSDNSKRKYPYSWELTETKTGDWICVNTLHANKVVKEAFDNGLISEFSGYSDCRTEVAYGTESSRIDLLLQAKNKSNCYIEIKSVTLLQNGRGYFPDAVTQRGQKHLRELQHIAEHGERAVLFFAVLHSGITSVSPAKHIDPVYAELCVQAKQKGVEIICYRASLSQDGIALTEKLPVTFD